MNTRFVIPATVAATLHGLAFLNLHPATGPKPACGDNAIVSVPDLVRLVDPPELVEIDDLPAQPSGKPDVRRSEEIELPQADREVINVPLTPTTSGPVIYSDRIPVGPIGRLDGIEGVERGPGVVAYTRLDNPPMIRSRISPVYPFEAKNSGRLGEVLVEFVVDESGHVINPRVVRSSDAIFESPTLRAVSKWRFAPGMKNGRAVRFRMALPVQFSLND